jgi:hypothetical protein
MPAGEPGASAHGIAQLANGLLNPITFAYCLWKNC